jgi:hypothetical protein
VLGADASQPSEEGIVVASLIAWCAWLKRLVRLNVTLRVVQRRLNASRQDIGNLEPVDDSRRVGTVEGYRLTL